MSNMQLNDGRPGRMARGRELVVPPLRTCARIAIYRLAPPPSRALPICACAVSLHTLQSAQKSRGREPESRSSVDSEMSSDSSECEVLPLQTSALHYISRNIREFAPREVANLPVRLRGVLFSSLPAVDICHLEDVGDLDGPVCDGVCLSEVWEGVYTNRLLTVPEYVESALLGTACLGERSLDYNCVWGDQDCEWKEEKVEVWDTNRDAFLARTANCVFMNDRGCKRAALQGLFCVPQVSSTISLCEFLFRCGINTGADKPVPLLPICPLSLL